MSLEDLAAELASEALEAIDLGGGGCGYSNCYTIDWNASQKSISAALLAILQREKASE